MRKLYRSMLWSGLVVAGVAACGDDVTVTPPPPPPAATVHSVSVAPTGATLSAGSTLQMVSTVQADAGVATTVTWSSSDQTRATVSATGLVTSPAAAAAGSVAITACSTVVTTVCGSATVNIAGAVPVTLSIASITNTVVGTGEVPVNINNVAGQINITLNLDAGTQNVAGVDVLLDGVVVASQNFSATIKAEEIANSLVQVLLSVNTAKFNPAVGAAVCPGTPATPSAPGAACFLNGPRILTARARLAGTTTSVATPSTTLIFNNANFVNIVTATVNGSSASSGTGILWQTGDLTATALVVIYTAGNPAIQQVVLTPTGGLASKTITTAPFTATWAKGTSIATGGAGSGSTGIELAGLVVNANSTVGGAVGPIGTSNALNFDTQAPGAPTFVANPNNRQNGWINAAVGLAGSNTGATDNDWLLNGAPDGGVGGYVRMLRIGATTGLVDAAIAATASATPTLPARTLNNNDQCAVASATDLLGNESTRPVAGSTCLNPPAGSFVATGSTSLRFGVDIDAPTIAFSGGLAALSSGAAGRILAATVGAQFQVTVADAGAIGVSGMLGGAPVIGNVQIFNATGTICLVGGTACANTSTGFTPALPLVATNTVAASVIDGYYTGVFIAQDAAGNQSPSVTRSIVHEVAGNPGVMTNALFNVPLSGSQATFNALATDNLDLRDVQYALTYGGGLAAAIQYPRQNINATPPVPATLQNTNVSVGTTINGFMRQVENVTANGPVTVGGAFKPTNLAGTLRDQVQTSAAVNTGILAGQVTTGVSYLAAAAPQLIRSWAITTAATLVSDNAGPGAAVNPLSVNLVADAFGPTATFNAPFTRVDYYALFGGFLVQIGTGTADITFDDGSAFGRRQRWIFSWTPGTSVGLGAISIFAIGVNANGDALVSPVNTNVTVTNP